jgi:hypothetical protein
MIDLSPDVIAFGMATVIPFLVALATKLTASARIKSAVAGFFAVVTTVVSNSVVAETGHAVFSWQTLAVALVSWALAGASYQTIAKPIVNPNARLLPGFGIGPRSPYAAPTEG